MKSGCQQWTWAGGSRPGDRWRWGSSIVLMGLMMLVLFGFAALSVDIGRVYQQQRQLHVGTDAGALAGAALLTNSPISVNAIIEEARQVALANGVTDEEIAAGARRDLPGAIQVGRWNEAGRVFTPAATPYNAVRVPARRTVPMAFARVLGLGTMSPVVESVAILTGTGVAVGVIPFGIAQSQVRGKQYGDILENVNASAPGNWGKLDLGGNMSSLPNFLDAMVGGYGQAIAVGDKVSPGTGVAGLQRGFDARLQSDPFVVIPITDSFNNGNHDVEVVGFLVGELLSQGGNGRNWNGQIRFVERLAGIGGGGPSEPPFARFRVLVE